MDIESIIVTGGLAIFVVFFVTVGGVVIYGLTHGRPNDQAMIVCQILINTAGQMLFHQLWVMTTTIPILSIHLYRVTSITKDTKMTLNTEKILTVLAFPAVAVTSYGYMYDWGVRKICVIWLCIVLFVALYVGGGYLGIALAKLTKATQRNGR